MNDNLRRLLNGCNGEKSLCEIPVYHRWETGSHSMEELGEQLEKKAWIQEKVPNPEKAAQVAKMLQDWELYENGWLIERFENFHLYRYLAQLGQWGRYRPDALEYIEPRRVRRRTKNAWSTTSATAATAAAAAEARRE
jgi:hypothetical protein